MKGLERIIHDDSNGLDYILVGEVYLPLLQYRMRLVRLDFTEVSTGII